MGSSVASVVRLTSSAGGEGATAAGVSAPAQATRLMENRAKFIVNKSSFIFVP
jgi:hypothetical protein